MKENPTGQPGIMVVDDQPANLKLMEDMLLREGYMVRSFPRGRMALANAAEFPPDLILLDITMPEMDGFTVCERLKADPKLAAIPVIFLSALSETEDKVKAFQCGGVDYVTKPFQMEEVHARVKTHLALHRARQVERDLLEKTLTGAVRSMADLILLSGPSLGERSAAVQRIVAHITSRFQSPEAWQCELAATLCFIGGVVLPVEVFERGYTGAELSSSEEQMYRSYPQVGSQLLSNIPRMEMVAAMVLHQHRDPDPGKGSLTGAAARGALMLRIAQGLDRRLLLRAPLRDALAELKRDHGPNGKDIIASLDDYRPALAVVERKRVRVFELQSSMIVEDDVTTRDGLIILGRETSLNPMLIDRVQNFSKTRGVCDPIRVRILRSDTGPRSPGAPH
jgi:response regulator RpfG family c-di-GMP phosphodiesterase